MPITRVAVAGLGAIGRVLARKLSAGMPGLTLACAADEVAVHPLGVAVVQLPERLRVALRGAEQFGIGLRHGHILLEGVTPDISRGAPRVTRAASRGSRVV